MRSRKVPELPVGPVERTATLDLMLSQQVVVVRLIVFVVYCECVVVVEVVRMKTVEFRRSCIPEARLQMNVFDVEVNDVVIGMVIGVVIDIVDQVVVFEVVLIVVVAVAVSVHLVVVVVVEVVPLGIGEVVVVEH